MRGRIAPLGCVGLAVASWVLVPVPLAAQNAVESLTPEAAEAFLENARVVKAEPIGRGITHPFRLTLTDGTLTHDAALNVVNEQSSIERFVDGTFELNFIDSYRYNIAAYRLARLLGLQDFIPATVERRWNGRIGSLSWWLDDAMEEGERLRQQLRAPDPQAWNRQIYRVRLFNNLVYDTDRHLGNMMVTTDWHAWLIDFTRAFRKWKKLPAQSDLSMVDGYLLDRLRTLTAELIIDATAPHLLESEVDALIERRDLIVDHFDRLIGERGRGAVVY